MTTLYDEDGKPVVGVGLVVVLLLLVFVKVKVIEASSSFCTQ